MHATPLGRAFLEAILEMEWGAVPVGCFANSTPELYSSLWWGGVKKPRWSAGRRSVFSPENTRTSSPEGVPDALARRPPAPPIMVRDPLTPPITVWARRRSALHLPFIGEDGKQEGGWPGTQ